jgi:hypothetical protein
LSLILDKIARGTVILNISTLLPVQKDTSNLKKLHLHYPWFGLTSFPQISQSIVTEKPRERRNKIGNRGLMIGKLSKKLFEKLSPRLY